MTLIQTALGTALGIGLGLAIPKPKWLWQPKRPLRTEAWSLDKTLGTPQLLSWIDASTQGWLILTPDLRIAYINSRAERLLQISKHLLVRGQILREVLAIPELETAVMSACHQQRQQRIEWDQQGDPLEAFVLPGAYEWLLILLQSRRSLEAQQQHQARWVSDVAHELKTPLTALMLIGDRLEIALPEAELMLVRRLQKELGRLKLMVEDLLELSRLENSLPYNNSSYSALALIDLVESAWNSIRPLADQHNVSLQIRTAEPGLMVGDQRRLHRAVLNLLDNALRYSPDGDQVEVRILSSGAYWLVSIRDHGPGLSEADLTNMFQRFYRGDPSRARSNRCGSGLGLAIVQQIAINHGGRIKASNHPDGGTSMELALPKGSP